MRNTSTFPIKPECPTRFVRTWKSLPLLLWVTLASTACLPTPIAEKSLQAQRSYPRCSEETLVRWAHLSGFDHRYAEALTCTRILVEQGADVNTDFGAAIKTAAGADRHGKVLGRLLAYGGNPHLWQPPTKWEGERSGVQWLALHQAVAAGRSRNVGLLLHHNASPNWWGPSGASMSMTPLLLCAAQSRKVWQLKSDGTPMNKDDPHPPPDSITEDPKIAQLLIDAGARLDDRDAMFGMTPLHWAVRKNRPEMVEVFIRNKADLQATDFETRTPLDLAQERGHTEIARLLKRAGTTGARRISTPPAEDLGGELSRVVALCADDGTYQEALTGVERLIDKGIDPNEGSGLPLRIAAAKDRRGHVLRRLLELGADPNFWTPPKMEDGPLKIGPPSALLEAVRALNARNTQTLIEFGADANRPASYSPRGKGELMITPLVLVCSLPISKDRFLPDQAKTREEAEMDLRQAEIVRLLLEAGSSPSEPPPPGYQYPFSSAIELNKFEVVKAFLDKEREVERVNSAKSYAFNRAKELGHNRIARLLGETGREPKETWPKD